MKKFMLTLFSVFIFASTPAAAKPIVNIGVNGMVCDFCAQAVMKVFEENENVENIQIDMDEALVSLTLKNGTSISDEEIEKNIHYSGYDLVSIERLDDQK